MRIFYYAFCTAYFAFLVWAIFAPWHSATAGYLAAAMWFVFWFLETRENFGLRRKINRIRHDHIHDIINVAKKTAKITAQFMKEVADAHNTHVRQLEQQIWQKDGLIKVYETNEKDRLAKAQKGRRAKGPKDGSR